MTPQPALDDNGNSQRDALALDRMATGSAALLSALGFERSLPAKRVTSKRTWRDRDYILIGAPSAKRLPDNPFKQKYRVSAAVIDSVADAYGIPPEMLKGQGRSRDLTYPRSIVCRLLRDYGLSYPEIGNRLGGRDHSTVIHAVGTTFRKAIASDVAAKSIYQHHRHLMAMAANDG